MTPPGGNPTSPQPPIPPVRPAPPPLAQQPIIVQTRKSSCTGWKIFALISFLLLLTSLVLNPFHFITSMFQGQGASLQPRQTVGPRLQEAYLEYNDSRNKIAVIPVEGIIMGQSVGRGGYNLVDLIEDQFQRAAKDERVKAVILKVNSPGGAVLPSDDINRIVTKFQDTTSKPVVAAMGSLAASGGYYVSAPCQWIVAHEMTITGSIGVIMAGWNYRGLMDKVGLHPEVFKSGKYKDMLSGEKRPEEITPEEREMVQSLVNETFDRFKNVVAEGRGAAEKRNQSAGEKGRPLVSNWEQYADGRIFSGKEAHRLGFVDELGNFDVAVSCAQKLAQIENANLIQYEQIFELGDIFSLFGEAEGKAESRTVKVDLGFDAPKLQAGNLYFLSPLVLPR